MVKTLQEDTELLKKKYCLRTNNCKRFSFKSPRGFLDIEVHKVLNKKIKTKKQKDQFLCKYDF